MCNHACFDFSKRNFKEEYIRGKSIIEVGSMDVNGSLRAIVESARPSEYIGVDFQMGPGVDQVCKAEELIGKFGYNRFDGLICTEVLEHVEDWKNVIHNFKQIIKPGGILLITTVSSGYPYHGFPFDFWRYEISDMRRIFCDFDIKALENDPLTLGIFLLAVKPLTFVENEASNLNLYSIIPGVRASVKTTSICQRVIDALLRALNVEKERGYHHTERISYYSKHPFAALAMIRRKWIMLQGKGTTSR